VLVNPWRRFPFLASWGGPNTCSISVSASSSTVREKMTIDETSQWMNIQSSVPHCTSENRAGWTDEMGWPGTQGDMAESRE
jgi:hypothetical protein